MEKNLQIYIHIPFCVKKCAYCDFLSGPQNQGKIETYVNSLEEEIRMYNVYTALSPNETVTTIFFGGGTPSILNEKQIERIFKALRDSFKIDENAEITIEANPGTVTKEKLETYKRCGINRISFGLQSANNEELKLLGRIHTFEEFCESYQLARKCGFDNINVDLISAIPKQTLQSFEETLSKVIEMNPEHISAYSLIVEEGTPFYELYGSGGAKEAELPDEDVEREIYKRTEELLNLAGYSRYEISNYAKTGKMCRHNMGYWERKNYLGFGLGAASLIENVRYKNTDDLEFYITNAKTPKLIQEEVQQLSEQEQIEEFMFLGLRKTEGISKTEFQETFGTPIETYYEEQINRLLIDKLLEENGERLCLTKRGIDVSNYVLAEFIK